MSCDRWLELFLCAEARSGAAVSAAAGADGAGRAAPSSSPSTAGAPQDAVSRDLSALDAAAPQTRAEALADSPRVKIETPAIFGSLALKGARIDDVALKAYRETVDPDSPNIILLSPPGAPDAYYAEAGFLSGAGAALALPPRRHALARRPRHADAANAGDAEL
ncbi:protein of unknown function [Methylocella tundrae]|uniref:Membrane protein insertase YidC n=1 Tax=Methylocella tundrae TaxID=227605 RepID=A0A4U8YUK6_METTU|nr:protein of unknown function [Methylocella tundrae]